MNDDTLFLVHMYEAAAKIADYVHGLTRQRFDADEVLELALLHLVQIVGEAARRVGPETRSMLSAVPWNQITSMRHRIVHDYSNVDRDVLWKVMTVHVPELVVVLAPTLGPLIERKPKEQN